MVQYYRSVPKLEKLEFVILIITAFLIIMQFADLSKADDKPSFSPAGSWEVYKDDDRPNGPIPREIMSFWEDGKLLISGDHPNKGLYRINGNYMEFLIKKGDRAITGKRQFILTNGVLKFKNEKVGWVYYKLINRKPIYAAPDFR